jgi:hypothetical protein
VQELRRLGRAGYAWQEAIRPDQVRHGGAEECALGACGRARCQWLRGHDSIDFTHTHTNLSILDAVMIWAIMGCVVYGHRDAVIASDMGMV